MYNRQRDFNMATDKFTGYFNLQLYVLADDNLDLVESVIYCYFLSYHHAKRDIFVSNEFLAKITKTKKRKVIYAISGLEKKGYIEKTVSKHNERVIKILDKDITSYQNNHTVKDLEENNTEVHLMHGGVHNMHGGDAPNAPYNKEDNKEDNTAISESVDSPSTIKAQEIVNISNDLCRGWPKIIKIDSDLKNKITKMQKEWPSYADCEFSLEGWRELLMMLKKHHDWMFRPYTKPSGKLGKWSLRTLVTPKNLAKIRNNEFN